MRFTFIRRPSVSPRRNAWAVMSTGIGAVVLGTATALNAPVALAETAVSTNGTTADTTAPAVTDSPALKPSGTSSPGMFAGAFQLPQRWNEDFKPYTECATPGSAAKYVSAQHRWFKQTDAATVGNNTEEAVPVTHKVTNKRVQTTEVSATVTPDGELAKLLNSAYGFNYVYQAFWKLTETVGPYTLQPHQQGRLVWGFTILDADVQPVKCTEDLQWAPTGATYKVSVPEGRYSELRLEEAPDFG
ncbi:hypothetical protein [Corynebacterium auriscanis]|uniref:hypothetical protein n=1 Tax=Corynebacterium auriscanis TaxID=99807 RepID=UPI003CF495A7